MITMRIAVLTSGGDAPGMNAAIRAVTRAAIAKGYKVYGVFDGYKGLVEGKFEKFNRSDVSETLNRGGTILGTARLPEFNELEIQKLAIKQLTARGIDGVIVIGGDGTYRGAKALTELGIKCIGIPGTIDNDIAGTEFTIGFDTALNTAVECVDKLRDTSASHRRCSIIEVMGRNCGDLAIWTAMATGAEYVVCKETGFDMEHLIATINKSAQSKNHAIIIVAENMVDINLLAKEVSEKTPFQARASVLGHIQRGGKPSARDRVIATEMGVKAVQALIDGESGVCVCINDGKICTRPFTEALGDNSSNIKEKHKVFNRLR